VKLAASSEEWVRAACADLPTLLVDHAHCEKKAAHTAVRFLFKYPEWPNLVAAMSRLAREELVHFDQVLREMKSRGIALRSLTSANYAAELFAAAKRFGDVGELLACALIEARSHERFVRLAEGVADPDLAAFYRELAAAEERHGGIYVELAEELAQRSVAVELDQLAAREAEILARPGQPLRMHAG
jgi:tRNA 2-(methylsulfanyl)-N6-isopentenyladenosine37 hydroxylase